MSAEIETVPERMMGWEERLPWAAEIGPVAAAAIAELALGEPVDVARVAARASLPAADALDVLRRSPAEFDDEGRLVGFGLTLRPTAHRFEVGGRTLYTWCALDTLAFPAVLGKPAQIESPCFATGEMIRIEVDPDGVRAVDPVQAVVSIVTPDVGLSDFRQQLCHEQHFFSSRGAAADWHAERPDAIVVPVREGFALTRALVSGWFGSAATPVVSGDAFDRALAQIPSCALDEAGQRDQKARYGRLATSVSRVQREPDAVVIEFDQHLDRETLEQTIVAERECCPFLGFAFDEQRRRLRVSVTDADMLPALDAIAHGFASAEHRTPNSFEVRSAVIATARRDSGSQVDA